LLARGARVIGVVRNPDRVPELAARGVELRPADLADRAALARGFAGADAVVSNAALFSLRNRRWEDHHHANIQGTRNVFDALADAGVRRVVHVSSVAVYRARGRGVDEEQPQLTEASPRTRVNAYAISKAVSEQLAWSLAAARDLALTTVRPCAIYGAFDPNFTRVCRALLGFPITVIPAFLVLPLVYAGDVADGIARALVRTCSIGRAYNLTGDDCSFGAFAAAWGAAGGRTAWVRIPVPVPLRWTFDHRRATADLDWRNRPFVDGLRETFAREAGAAPGGRNL
jgi:nucleoside-diphosphate-sugar epimerase